MHKVLESSDYHHLLELRTALRRFLDWSEEQARAAGLTPAQHQLLLAVRGHRDPLGPTIRDITGYLVVRHRSVVGLIGRAARAGWLRRARDPASHRSVRLRLSGAGAAKLAKVAARHVEELRRLSPALDALTRALTLPATAAA